MDIKKLKKLRDETGISIAEIKKALEETDNNIEEARKILKKRGLEKAKKKGDRETKQGVVESYIHGEGRIGTLVSLGCETDFVARTDEFKNLAKEIAMQVAAMHPQDVNELMSQEYVRNPKTTIENMIKEKIAKLGENIQINSFCRYEI